MKSKILSIVLIMVFLFPAFVEPKSVKAATNCQCVTYIKNYYGLIGQTGNAYQMGAWLLTHGFVEIANPEIGAVAIMQPDFFVPSLANGHVGIIVDVEDYSSTKWRIKLKGANQPIGDPLFSEFACDNVRITRYAPYLKTNTKIKYYKTKDYAIRTVITQTGYKSLVFDVYNGGAVEGTYINGYPFHGGANQRFNRIKYGAYYRIVARNSGMCVVPETATEGARLVQRKCKGNDIEKWQFTSTSTGLIIRHFQTGYVVDLAGGSLNPETWILIWTSHDGLNQRWKLTYK